MVGFDLWEVVFGFKVAGWEGHQRQRHAGRARLLPARFYILLPTHFLTHLTIIIQSGTLFLYQFYSAGPRRPEELSRHPQSERLRQSCMEAERLRQS